MLVSCHKLRQSLHEIVEMQSAMQDKTVAVVGASVHRQKFGNKAVRAFAAQGFRVFPIHPTATQIEGHAAYRSVLDVPVTKLDRVTLYVPPKVGVGLLDDIARKLDGELWINPGAESDELFEKATKLGMHAVFACSILAVGMDPGDL